MRRDTEILCIPIGAMVLGEGDRASSRGDMFPNRCDGPRRGLGFRGETAIQMRI